MPYPQRYWSAYEHEVGTLAEFLETVQKITAFQTATESRFVWRGVANSAWPMYSKLVRCYREKYGEVPQTESTLREFELRVLTEARDWRLDWHAAGGQLTALETLAALQHFGVPSRMLDFSFNPLIALWFAAETVPEDDGPQGRVFAIDIAGRVVDRERASEVDPWWLKIPPTTYTEWTTRPWIWRPPPLEPRIVRQEGCFLMGGIPSTRPARAVDGIPLRATEIRECMSVPFALIQYEQAVAAYEARALRGPRPGAPAFALLISNKQQLRTELEQSFSYSFRSLFPDFSGMATYGKSFR